MEKRERLHKVLDEACDHGLGEFYIKIRDDGEFFIVDTRWNKNPSDSFIKETIELAIEHRNVGIEIIDGSYPILKIAKKIKI